MWPSMQDWISALSIIVPTYCANGAPIIFGGGLPMDLGKSFPDGKRIFGDNKTFRGFLSGLIIGSIVGVFGYVLFSENLFAIAFSASAGALLGDLAGAFLKRRLGIRPGGALPGVDQLDFVVGALLLVAPFYRISWAAVAILLLVTPPIHFLTNATAYRLRLKSAYW